MKFKNILVLGALGTLLGCSGGNSGSAAAPINPDSAVPAVSAAHPTFLFALAPLSNLGIYAIDSNSGAVSLLTSTVGLGMASNFYALALSPGGNQFLTTSPGIAQLFSFASGGTPALTNTTTTSPSGVNWGLASNPVTGSVVTTSSNSNSIQSLAYDIEGDLNPLGSAQLTGSNPHGVAIDPFGQFAYVANTSDNSISVFPIARSGAMLPTSQTISSGGSHPKNILIDPLDRFVYVVNLATIGIFQISDVDGSLTFQGAMATHSEALSMTIDPTGQVALIPNNTMASVSLYYIDPVYGSLTEVPNSPIQTGNGPTSAVINSTSQWVYVANASDATLSVFALDLIGLSLNLVSNSNSIPGIQSMLISQPTP